MAEPFLSEIRIVSFQFAPKGWALCNGQLLPINQNQALFSLLGTTYGGNGQTTFALPNLRGQVPIHFGNGFDLGQTAGSTTVTLNQSQMPQHLHMAQASANEGTTRAPSNSVVLAKRAAEIYHTPTNPKTMNANSVTSVGGSQPHNNMMPYLVLNFIIALQGIFPSRN